MSALPDQSSVIYRKGLEQRDYVEAIEALQDANKQREDKSRCSVCHSDDHLADQCHHNPLVMARRAVGSINVWRCYHCGEKFTDHAKAADHFGAKMDGDYPKCFDKALELLEIARGQLSDGDTIDAIDKFLGKFQR